MQLSEDELKLNFRFPLPTDATHTQLRLLLRRRRVTLLRRATPGDAVEEQLMVARLAGAIEPRRTAGYAIRDGALLAVLHKARPGLWGRLALDGEQQQQPQQLPQPQEEPPQPLSEASRLPPSRRPGEPWYGALARTRHSWRSRLAPIRAAASFLPPLDGVPDAAAAPADPPTGAPGVELATGDIGGGGGGGGGGEAGAVGGREAAGDEKGEELDDEDDEAEEDDEADYPLPGSRAGCDGCGRIVRRYYHCLRCGEDEGFDLCTACYRGTGRCSEHQERHGRLHAMALVTARSAPVEPRQLQVLREQRERAAARLADEQRRRAQLAARDPPPEPPPEPLVARVRYSWTQHHAEVEVKVRLGAQVRKEHVRVEVAPRLLCVSVEGHGAVLRGTLHAPVVSGDSVWVLERGELQLLLAKSDKVLWKKLFPQEEALGINDGIAAIRDDDDDEGRLSYMELSPEARGLVDLHRDHRHARATGKEAWAADLEEEMKMMQFSWR